MADSFSKKYAGVFSLVIVCLVSFGLYNLASLSFMNLFPLNHLRPAWYQFVTSLFLHGNFGHLSGNLFFLYVFGKIVEE